jgi:peptidoglycan/LPS O-acetylase OafA/YrhL
MKHIPQLDGIRCVAILSVIIGHWIAWDVQNVFVQNIPWSHGVLLFFVLSGYLITNILLSLKEKIEQGQTKVKKALFKFYIRRLPLLYQFQRCQSLVSLACNIYEQFAASFQRFFAWRIHTFLVSGC